MAGEQSATDDAVASLRSQMARVTSERDQIAEEATTAVADAQKKAADAVAARLQSDKAAIQNGIAAADAAADAAELRLAEAAEKSDHVALARANREIAEAIATKNSYINRKANLEAWEKTQAERAKQQIQQPQRPQPTPSGRTFTPETQAWLEKNGIDGHTDNSKFLKAQGSHFRAQAEGLKADTPEYFAFLDKDFGGGTASVESPLSQASDTMVVDLSKPPTPQGERREIPALAPSRPAPVIAPTSNQIVNGRVTLTAGEVESARFSNPDLYKRDPEAAILEYAQNKAKLIQEGRL